MGVTRVVLHIDRLTLRGFEHTQGGRFAVAFKHELASALARPDVATGLATQVNKPHLRASMAASGGTPRATAIVAARALATELSK